LESIESATLPVKAVETAVPVDVVQLSPYTDTWPPGAAVLGCRSTLSAELEVEAPAPAAAVVAVPAEVADEPCEAVAPVAGAEVTMVPPPGEAVVAELLQAALSRPTPEIAAMARLERRVILMSGGSCG
jgi:hypothetical protein